MHWHKTKDFLKAVPPKRSVKPQKGPGRGIFFYFLAPIFFPGGEFLKISFYQKKGNLRKNSGEKFFLGILGPNIFSPPKKGGKKFSLKGPFSSPSTFLYNGEKRGPLWCVKNFLPIFLTWGFLETLYTPPLFLKLFWGAPREAPLLKGIIFGGRGRGQKSLNIFSERKKGPKIKGRVFLYKI